MTRALASCLATALGAGCLIVPDEARPMCEKTTDCDDASGEICADGVCWGDPPPGDYAIRLGPPAGSDLVPTEITAVEISADGWIQTPLVLERPVAITGTVTLACADGGTSCAHPAIAATVTVTRAARIRGGPAFVAVAATTEDSPGFSIKVPRGLPDETYVVTIAPDRGNASRTPLDTVAPARLELQLTDAPAPLDLQIGEQLRRVTGMVNRFDGGPVVGATVVVRGKWDPEGAMTELSSLATTTATGAFEVFLPTTTFEPSAQVVVTPAQVPGDVQPTLSLDLALSATETNVVQFPLVMPDLGLPQLVTMPVRGTSLMGDVENIAGAQVTVVAEQIINQIPAPPLTARISAVATTNADGEIQVWLVPSSMDLGYQVFVKPPPRSGPAQYATVYGRPVEVLPSTAILAPMYVPNQVSIRGQLFGFHDGRAAEGLVVTATPNRDFAIQLSSSLQRVLGEAVPTSETTNSDGAFAIFVDPEIAGSPVEYDVRFEPAAHTLLPIWQPEPILVDVVTGHDMGARTLPPAAYIRGRVMDPDAVSIAGAEVRLYDQPVVVGLCEVCPAKAILRAQATSGTGGVVHLVLSDE